jgi:hypothetical protein
MGYMKEDKNRAVRAEGGWLQKENWTINLKAGGTRSKGQREQPTAYFFTEEDDEKVVHF